MICNTCGTAVEIGRSLQNVAEAETDAGHEREWKKIDQAASGLFAIETRLAKLRAAKEGR